MDAELRTREAKSGTPPSSRSTAPSFGKLQTAPHKTGLLLAFSELSVPICKVSVCPRPTPLRGTGCSG